MLEDVQQSRLFDGIETSLDVNLDEVQFRAALLSLVKNQL